MKRGFLSVMAVCSAIIVAGCSSDAPDKKSDSSSKTDSTVKQAEATAISSSPNVKKAEEFVQVKMYAEALNALQKEILDTPKNADAHLLTAKIYLLQGDEDKARESFERAILIETKQKRRVGETYKQAADETFAQDEERALALYRTATQYDSDTGAAIAQTFLKRAEELSQTARDATKPLAYLNYCLEFDPGQREKIAEFAYTTAALYFEKDFKREAAAYAQRSASLSPNRQSDIDALLQQFTPKEGAPFTDLATGMEFVWVPGGEFWMGCGENEQDCGDDEKPRHLVRVKGFWIGKYEVTRAQWETIMGENPSKFKGANRPVDYVSWDDAQEFLQKLNATVGAGSEPAPTFRLPSEAEWEYAARAGTQTAYSFGDDPDQLGDYAWYSENSNDETHPVGQKQPNAFGLYDMHGNVWEWVADTYHSNYDGAPTDGSARVAGGSNRVLRGGSWYGGPWGVRSAHRNYDPAVRGDGVGFRVLRTK